MAENKMAEVAKLFGKKLGEEFKAKCTTGEILERQKEVRFGNDDNK